MKVLILVSTLDLKKPFSATPAIWQLLKGMYETGNELLLVPYSGRSIDSLWWRSYNNPNYYKSSLLEKFLGYLRTSKTVKNSSLIPQLAQTFAKPSLEKLILKILDSEKDVEALLAIGVPMSQLRGLPEKIRRTHKIPIVSYDLDTPTSLPSHGGFTFNYYNEANLSEYECIIITSEGSIAELKELGARKVHVVHFGIDPQVYIPFEIEKDIDIFFFGTGAKTRINNINMMITEPSLRLSYRFMVSGRDFEVNLGNAKLVPPLPFSKWIRYCRRSKINLNVVRELHANVFATSSFRPFELAALESCIVSSPYLGIEKWFEVGKELFVVSSSAECLEVYKMLIEDEELRLKTAKSAYQRVIKEHTAKHRANEIVQILLRYT